MANRSIYCENNKSQNRTSLQSYWGVMHLREGYPVRVILTFFTGQEYLEQKGKYHFPFPYTYELYRQCCQTHRLLFYGPPCRYLLKWINRVDWDIMAIHSLCYGSLPVELTSNKVTIRNDTTWRLHGNIDTQNNSTLLCFLSKKQKTVHAILIWANRTKTLYQWK